MLSPYSSEFQIAQETLLRASEIAVKFFRSSFTSRLKADDSVVTEADEAVEAFIRTELLKHFPTYGFIGEEGTIDTKKVSWIVDPIDGTSSFARGISDFSNVLALVDDNQVMFTCIYYPMLQELYSARLGEGAYKNGQMIHVSEVTDLQRGIISINGKNFHKPYSQKHAFVLASKFRTRIGYAGVESCLLAQGSIEALVKFDQHIWDVAPEQLLITEAGGVFTDEFNKPLTYEFTKESLYNYIATTPIIQKEFSDILYFKPE